MNTETLTVHQKGDDFEIIVQHDQTGSAYGITLSKSAYEQLRLHFVGVSLPVERFDVDDWLGLTHGVWYHPFIELHNYDNGDKKSIELSQIIADYANSIIRQ